MSEYKFDPEAAFGNIMRYWSAWANETGAKAFVVGVSGGKDSTVALALANRIFGCENAIGVMLPNGEQSDIGDSHRAIQYSKGVAGYVINIKEANDSILRQVKACLGYAGNDAIVNLPPRLRMATLYAVAQTLGAFVVNTDNLSERMLGYFTMWGDGAGDFAPLRGLTATEVVQLGKFLGIPDVLVEKKPGDGLQALGDEDRFGFTYEVLDRYIREGKIDDPDAYQKIIKWAKRGQFKTKVVDVDGPLFSYYRNFLEADLICPQENGSPF